MLTRSRSCINNGDGTMKNRKMHKPVPNTGVNSPEVNPANLARLDTRSCANERIGKENGGFAEEDASPQHEQQFKRSRKNKNKLLIAKITKVDVEGGGSLDLETHKDKDKVISDDYCDQKATVTEKMQMGVLNNMSLNVNVTPYSGRRNDQIRIPHLSEEIIYNILVLLPAETIHEVIRYVSPVWFKIVHDPYFITAHLLKSTTVLFIQSKDSPEFAHSAEVRETDVKITKIGYPFRGPVYASCDGLLLYGDLFDSCIVHVANPITKQHVRLPSLQSFDEYRNPFRTCALVYAASTRDYKVVHTYQDGFRLRRCLILTLGIDNAWREIEMKIYFRMEDPISVGRFVYWNSFSDDPFILVLDVETEGFYEIPPPKIGRGNIIKSYIPMGSSLSLVVSRPGFSVEAWVLRKPKTGKWARLPNIDIEGQRHIYESIVFPSEYWDHAPVDRRKNKYPKLYAFAWMKDGEVLIFRVAGTSRSYIVHNLKTGQVYPFKLDEYAPGNVDYVRPYIHSLVSFRSNLVSPLSFPPRCTMCKSVLSSPPPLS